ncbi:adenylate/guanylate cyclase domain-containing protein [Croceibacter atlanticus]|uniref:adenylate/guanylate cyclase domain-containing protein n=1 Tax=Croceibacter atlanticus TaxID=313588 RepID=UPI0030DA6BC2
MKSLIKTILVVLLLSVPLIMQWTPLEIIKLKTFDALVTEKQQSNYFTVLNITEEDIEREGGWPLPRARLAEIQREIIARGALGVGWTVAFPQKDRLGGDEDFAESLLGSNSILAMYENEGSGYPNTVGTVIMGDPVGGYPVSGVVQNIEILRRSAAQGIASAPVDVDQLVRRIPLLMKTPDGWVSAFGTEVLKALVGSDTYIIKTNQNGIQEVVVQGLPPVATDSLGRKWISWVNTDQTTLEEMNVNQRFVFIGTDAVGILPQVASPVGLLEPHKIQAALAESILIQDSPRIPDWSFAAELAILLLTVAIVWLLVLNLGVTIGITSFLMIFGVTAASGVYLIQSGMLIDVTWTLISQFFAASGAFYLNFRTQYRLRQQIKKQFEHYLDPRQVKELQKDPDLLKLGGELRYCTFLFTDLRGFTSMSEKMTPEEVADVMNTTLTIQVEEIQRSGGMVDKFIGDACMGIFSAPLDLSEHQNKAIEAAVRIQERIKKLNDTMDQEIQIGVGIQSGVACVGNMGSDTRFDYTAIGNCVNEAARYESSTKEVGVDILIGYECAKSCKYLLKELEPIKVKGKRNKLRVFTWDSSLQLLPQDC